MKAFAGLASLLVIGMCSARAGAQLRAVVRSDAAGVPPRPPPEPRRSEWVLGPSMGALFLPAAGRVGLAVDFLAFREIDDWAVGLRGTVATTDAQADSGAEFVALAIGGRRYFGRRTVSAFVGAGLAFEAVVEPGAVGTFPDACLFSCSGPDESRREHLRGGGAGAYAEAGFEFFRDHPIRLITSLRVDLPFESLEIDRAADDEILNGVTSRYETPVTLNLGAGF